MPQHSTGWNPQFPSTDWESALGQLARWLGVQDRYWDIWGKEHQPEAAVTAAVLASKGVSTESAASIDGYAKNWFLNETLAALPACLVTAPSDLSVPVAVPGGAPGTASVRIDLESGTSLHLTVNLESVSTVEFDSRHWTLARFSLPSDLPFGYHRITFRQTHTASLIHCPDRVYDPLPPEQKAAGVAISLYGLRSERNWGCGDFTDLIDFGRWAWQKGGASFVALNPLHAIANRTPYNTSPYLPASTFYRNFIYLDIEAVPEFAASFFARRTFQSIRPLLAQLREAGLVDYEGVARVKKFFLKLLYREFLRGGAERRAAFDAYRVAEGRLLERFAVYSALDEFLHRRNPNLWIWPDWPAGYQDPESASVREFASRKWRNVEFWQFVCWLVDQQAEHAQSELAAAGMPIGLYHDLALATDRCGSDLWAHRPFYANGCRVGAPPDDFSPKGQDWSFPPPDATRHRGDGYRLFAAAIRNNARHGGALRIDHVMRFFRLYWIPEGHDATQGTYVREPWRDLLRIVALESHRNRVMVIGEDLGTVEDYVREGLAEFGVLSYRLLYFERIGNGLFKRPEDYPKNAVVSSTTHDLPTLAGWWLGRDIEARRAVNLLTDEVAYHDQHRARLQDKHKLIEVLHDLQLLPPHYPRDAAQSPELTGDLHSAVVGFLASAPSRLFVLNQEDLTKETEQQNLPGSTWEYPNWRRKMRYSLEDLHTRPEVRDFLAMLRHWLEKTGRLR